uniref:Uncharacterized protein n=1 Tax=Sparus aurata TaxID=8175 RepID=A0A671VTJ6_SPAAU
MSAASCLLTEDQFLCSICLDVFTDPVSTPCGHNFCKTCITKHWDGHEKCPNCQELFNIKPELWVNTFISKMAAQFRQSAQQKASSSSSEQRVSKPGEVPCDDCTGTKLKALKSCLLEETLSKQIKKLLEVELKRVQQYAVDVTLDPDTAHPALILSDDGKQVNCGDAKKNLPDNPERFDKCVYVLANQSFSSGRFYYEVQVKMKTKWDLGVARESINRKGNITLSPHDGYWMICLRNKNEYYACAEPPVRLSLKHQPEKVGVFVDYEEGLVSFYDVDAAALIYSFTGCCFTHKLYPYFSPGLNDGGKNSNKQLNICRKIHIIYCNKCIFIDYIWFAHCCFFRF